MGFHLCHVQELLKKAYARAKNQIQTKQTRHPTPIREDIGHEKALGRAEIADVQLSDPSDMNYDYRVFLERARTYLELRGIFTRSFHKTFVVRYYLPMNNRDTSTRPGDVWEEALVYVGIPLARPSSKQFVDDRFGVVVAPATGEVSKSYFDGPDARLAVEPGTPLFDLLVWYKPSYRRTLKVLAEIGGLADGFKVKVGDKVDKDKTVLVKLRGPWVGIDQSLPCRTP